MGETVNFGNRLAVRLITFVVAILIVYVAFDITTKNRREKIAAASFQASMIAELASGNVTRALWGARDFMRMISRTQIFRETRPAGFLQPEISGLLARMNDLLQLMDIAFILYENHACDAGNALDYQFAVFQAKIRRILWNMDMLSYSEEFFGLIFSGMSDAFAKRRTDSISPSHDEPEKHGVSRLSVTSPVNVNAITTLNKLFLRFQDILTYLAHALDSFLWLGEPTIFDSSQAMDLLTATMSDMDLIRSLTVKNLYGRTMFGITEISEPINMAGRWVKRAASGSKPFYPGPVIFSEGLGRPLFNAAIPLRDLSRKPYALLHSEIDLAFLSETARTTVFTHGASLMILDEDKTIIGHPDRQTVINQINIARSNPALAEILEDKEGTKLLNIFGSDYIISFKSLKQIDHVNLPDWKVVFMLPASEVLGSSVKQIMNVVLWVALSFLVLFYVSDFILAHFDEDY